MKDKVVTVFGGTGFLGRMLVKRLAARGARLRIVTRNPEHAGLLRPMGDVGQIALFRHAGSEVAQIEPLVRGSDYVVNLVGILHERNEGDFTRVHVELAGAIATAAARQGVSRLVHVSAIGADPASDSAYARSKGEGEAAVRSAMPQAVILRPSIIFGPGDGFFCRFARMAMISPVLPLIDGGKTRFQPVYVGDVAEAILAGLEKPEAAGRTYELGGPRVATFAELLQYILDVTGRRRKLLRLPMSLARLQARLFEFLPEPPLTRDQLLMLRHDNVVAEGAAGLRDLGIEPMPYESIVPHCLVPYRRWRGHVRTARG